MTAKEYMEIAKRKGNERVCELIKFCRTTDMTIQNLILAFLSVAI